MSAERANKYEGECVYCGAIVPAGQGVIRRDRATGRGWQVFHRPAVWHGSPVSGGYVGGCPADTDALNTAGGFRQTAR